MPPSPAAISSVMQQEPARPISRAFFEKLMDYVRPHMPEGRIAVAVSGGPDSMALLVLLQEWAEVRGGDVLALTVDHRLRPSSAREARSVADWCAMWGIAHKTLVWEKEKVPETALHARARAARYELLLNACQAEGAGALFLAHHRQDQTETVLIRLEDKTGIDGAAGMPIATTRNGVALLRPLLPLSKESLIATCHARRIPFVRDPSNELLKYRRGFLRAHAAQLAAAHLTPERVYTFAVDAGHARATLETETNEWLSGFAMITPVGLVHMETKPFFAMNGDMQARMLSRILQTISGEDYPPRSASLETLLEFLSADEFTGHTLHGCRIEKNMQQITVMREENACMGAHQPLTAGENVVLWDNRFKIMVDKSLNMENVFIRPLSSTSREQLSKMNANNVAALPARIRATLPALYVGHELIHVPEIATASLGLAPSLQNPVKAVFFPKNPLIVTPFCPAPSLSSVFGVV